MQKLILILLAFMALFTFIRAIESAGASDSGNALNSEISIEKTVEFVQ